MRGRDQGLYQQGHGSVFVQQLPDIYCSPDNTKPPNYTALVHADTRGQGTKPSAIFIQQPRFPVFLTFPLQYSATCTSLQPFTCIGHRLLGDCSMVALLRAQRKNRGPVMPGSTGHPPESKRHSLMSQELLVHQNAVAEKKAGGLSLFCRRGRCCAQQQGSGICLAGSWVTVHRSRQFLKHQLPRSDPGLFTTPFPHQSS